MKWLLFRSNEVRHILLSNRSEADMDNRNNFNLGDEIKNIVQDAVNNRDFNRLNRDIGNMVNGALGEVRNSIGRNRWGNQSWKPNDYKPENEKDQQPWNGQKPNQQSNNSNGWNGSNNSEGNNTNNTGNNGNSNTYSNADNNKNNNTYSNTGNNRNNNTYSNAGNNRNNNTYSNTGNNRNNNAYSNTGNNRNNNTYSNAGNNRNSNTYSNTGNNRNNNAYSNTMNNRNTSTNANNVYRQGNPVSKPAVFTVPIGQVSGTLLTVFGTIGSALFVTAAIIFALLGYLLGKGGIFNVITLAMLPCIITFVIMNMNGSRIRNRLKRFKRYLSQLHGRNYCLIKDFSSITGLSIKYTVKDLQRMIAIGMFPEGHIDDKKTCFMLNSESYEQYLKLQENMQMRDLEERTKQKEQTGDNSNPAMKDLLKPEIRKSIEDGRQYVQKIRSANIAIPGEEISRKLDRLEEVTGKIFDYVEIHPAKISEIKKFTEYFLPTTLKLLDAYREFDFQPVEGENIANAKKEIEETLDTINLAFENLLDGLFEDAAMDISTDISVMETMFAQEGLTQKNVRS